MAMDEAAAVTGVTAMDEAQPLTPASVGAKAAVKDTQQEKEMVKNATK